MKRLILFTLLCPALYVGCSKDDDQKSRDSECGALISFDKTRTDGGIVEKLDLVACGAEWDGYKDINLQAGLKVYKGDTRAAATYLVAIKSDTIYIRYDGGNVPQATIDSFMTAGYTTKVETLTGLEHIKWP